MGERKKRLWVLASFGFLIFGFNHEVTAQEVTGEEDLRNNDGRTPYHTVEVPPGFHETFHDPAHDPATTEAAGQSIQDAAEGATPPERNEWGLSADDYADILDRYEDDNPGAFDSENREARRDFRRERDGELDDETKCPYSHKLGYRTCEDTARSLASEQENIQAINQIGAVATGVTNNYHLLQAAKDGKQSGYFEGQRRSAELASRVSAAAALLTFVERDNSSGIIDEHEDAIEELEDGERIVINTADENAESEGNPLFEVTNGSAEKIELKFGDELAESAPQVTSSGTYSLFGGTHGDARAAQIANRQQFVDTEVEKIKKKTKSEQETALQAAEAANASAWTSIATNLVSWYFNKKQADNFGEIADNLRSGEDNDGPNFHNDETNQNDGTPAKNPTLNPDFGQEESNAGTIDNLFEDDFDDTEGLPDVAGTPLDETVPNENVAGQRVIDDSPVAGGTAGSDGPSGFSTGPANTREQEAAQATAANVRGDGARLFASGAARPTSNGGKRVANANSPDLNDLMKKLKGEEDYKEDSKQFLQFAQRAGRDPAGVSLGNLFERISKVAKFKSETGMVGDILRAPSSSGVRR